MTKLYGTLFANVASGTADQMANGGTYNARIHSQKEVIDLSTIKAGVPAAIGDQIFAARLRGGDNIIGFQVFSSVALPGVTFAFGSDAVSAKYLAAAAVGATTNQSPTYGAPSAQANAALPTGDDVYATIGGAALPVVGLVTIYTIYSHR